MSDKTEIKAEVEESKAAVTEYQTKSVPVEVASGRVTKFISPDGQEYLVNANRVRRFRTHKGVDATWTVI